MPNSEGELSVFQISGLSESEIWETGKKYVSQPQGKTLHGRADIATLAVVKADLRLVADDNPPGHVNITGWPNDKPVQKIIAIELANQAVLFLKD